MRNNNKGITLIELIVVIALITVVLTVTYQIFFVSSKMFDAGVSKATLQHETRVASNQITDKLKFAKVVSTTAITGQAYYRIALESNTITGLNNMIVEEYNAGGTMTKKDIYSTSVKNMLFTTNVADSNIINFVIEVSTGKQDFTISSSVFLKNFTIPSILHGQSVFVSVYN